MRRRDLRLRLQATPLLRQTMTTPGTMGDVLIALLPASLAGVWWFGLGALLVLLAAIAGALLTEWVFTPAPERANRLGDGSALLTGLLLGLSLPPALPLWMAFLGGVVAIGLGKLIWGGLGHNPFNPALVGRAFLLATFPAAMTTWSPPGQVDLLNLYPANLAPPLFKGDYDALTSATPLGLMKFEHQPTDLLDLALGHTGGCLGETSGLLLLLGGLYLILRRALDWRVPAGILGTVALLTGALYLGNSQQYPDPLFALFSGGLLLGAFYMATDPVTSPLTPLGTWLYALGIGLLVVLIRHFGGFPEGVMYAILLMNAATPLIDRLTQPRVFGRGRARP